MILWTILCGFSSFQYKWYIYALKGCVELAEGCYLAKGMFTAETLECDLEITFHGQGKKLQDK